MSEYACSSTRREFLQKAGAGLLGLAAMPGLAAVGPEPGAKGAEWTPLGHLALQKGISFGFALNYRLLTTDPTYASLVTRECTIVTPENAMKWEGIHPAADQYTFSQADVIVAFAQEHSIKVRGHAFCWHRARPPWVMRDATPQTAEKLLQDHIATVAGRYKGKLHSWDVVNEAIQIKDGLADGWRNSFWYQMLGHRYVDIAFQAAHQADPSAMLTYNDYGLEYENHSDDAKRVTVLAMLRNLKVRNIPIRALGLQSHLRAGTGENFGNNLKDFIKQVHDLGLEVFVTELDVDDQHLTVEGIARDQAIADVYSRYLDLILDTGAVPVIVTWGAWDIPRATGAEASSGPKAERPLLFSAGGQPKLDALAVAKILRQTKQQH